MIKEKGKRGGIYCYHAGIRPKATSGSHRIVELNAQNFERNVHQPSSHVLVEFYRPGCQSCEDLGNLLLSEGG